MHDPDWHVTWPTMIKAAISALCVDPVYDKRCSLVQVATSGTKFWVLQNPQSSLAYYGCPVGQCKMAYQVSNANGRVSPLSHYIACWRSHAQS